MQLGTRLLCFGLRQVIGDSVEQVAAFVEQRFSDHSRALPRALVKAHDQAWQALAVALAGEGFFDQVKVLLASAEQKALRVQVDRFLLDTAFDFHGSSAAFRKTCLAELHRARQAGLLSVHPLPAKEVARLTADYRRYADLRALVDAAGQAVAEIADGLGPDYLTLAQLLRKPLADGPPLLAAAFTYFFRRQVETDPELANGLFFDTLQQLTAAQARTWAAVSHTLDALGDCFDEVLDELTRIETAVVATHGVVLDLQAELQRLGSMQAAHTTELRQLVQEALGHLHHGDTPAGQSPSVSPPPAAAPPPPAFAAARPSRPQPLENSEAALLVLDDEHRVRSSRNLWLRPGHSYDCTTITPGGELVAFALEHAGDSGGRGWHLWPTLDLLLQRVGQPAAVPTRGSPVCLPVRFVPRPPPRPGTLMTNSLGMQFARVPPGAFRMGSPPDEPGRQEDEFLHAVAVERGFYLGIYPVTQAQWQAIMGDNPSHFHGADRPVEHVSWFDCEAFCKRLSDVDGRRYALPTEAEWEYACRAGTRTAYHGGTGSAALRRVGWCSGAGETKPVGGLAANTWGLYDVHGNVWEWCRESYGPYPGDERGVVQPAEGRVARGGSWFDPPALCRSAARFHYDPAACNSAIGCRVGFYLDE